jgi:Rod binding domain-containing protein
MSIPVDASAAATAGTATGLPVVNQALEPAWVRHGSASTQKAYESALAFEQSLVEQLAKSLADTSGLSGEGSQEGGESGGEGSSTGSLQLSSMLPQALTSGVMDGGGLGMAAQMTRQLEGVQAPAAAKTSGGTSAA